MKAKVGMKFYDSQFCVHEVVKIDDANKGFWHVYTDGKRRIEGWMYNVAFERLLNLSAICVL